MNSQHSISLIFVWHVADAEARHLKASAIEPLHLLLGLCKVVDLDLPLFVSKDSPDRDAVLEELLREIRRLRAVFHSVGLDAKTFRRKLRRVSEDRRFGFEESKRLRRSAASKRIFTEAESFAQIGSCAVYPVHLLYAGLLAGDEHRDATLAELNIEKKRLLTVSKREVFGKQMDSASPSAKARTRWN